VRARDLVIYDTMFTPEEYRQTPTLGIRGPRMRSTSAATLARGWLALYHYAPDRSDTEVDAVLASTPQGQQRFRRPAGHR